MKRSAVEKKIIGILFLFVMILFSVADKDSKKLDLLNYQQQHAGPNNITLLTPEKIRAAAPVRTLRLYGKVSYAAILAVVK